MSNQPIDILWVLFCALLVFLMQAGFLALETGFTRNKNNINVALKNLADFSLTTLGFWAVGFGLMFGASSAGWAGQSRFFFTPPADFASPAFFIYQVMFCGTAVTILSGAVAERVRFGGYLIVALIVSTLIYPLFGHWSWNGLDSSLASGWLGQRGFVDFAGSTVVHSVGGWTSLALLLIIGPRLGRFPRDGQPRIIPAANIPLAALGVLILWVGWLGFNGGSLLAFNSRVPGILLNTVLAGSAGMIASMGVGWLRDRQFGVMGVLNGALAGLVAITAGAHAVTAVVAVLIGAVGGIIMLLVEQFLLRQRIDDAIGAIPVHLGAGIWGTIAVGLFGQLEILGTGLNRSEQIAVQLLGVGAAFVWTFGIGTLLFRLVDFFYPLRVSHTAEQTGLNVSEHKAPSAMLELFQRMEEQAVTGDLTIRVPVEPFTEAGQIAQQYNRVIASLQDAVARNETIVTTARDGIVTFAFEDWHITSCNQAALEILGYASAPALIGQRFTQLLVEDEENGRSPIDITHRILHSNSYVEVIGYRADGTTIPIELAISYSNVGNNSFYAAIFRDISRRQEAAQALSEARDRALEANQLKSEFLAIVSHELRTPLNAVIGLAEMVEDGIYGDVSPGQARALQEIIDSTETLESMVNDLLDQAQLDAGTLLIQQSPYSVAELFSRVEMTLGTLATAKGLRFIVEVDNDLPPVLLGDLRRMRQILNNLVGNSIKFTDTGQIGVSARRLNKAQWQIVVADTGVGVSPADQAHVFDPFRQVEAATTREHSGIGLGLSIVYQLVEKMGGQIILESERGAGSTFRVILPLVSVANISPSARD